MSELIIVGAGIAGVSAALGALDRGAAVTLFDAGDPPIPGCRHDLWLEAGFRPFGATPPVRLSWACTRLLGLNTATGYEPGPGYLVDREQLRAEMLAEAVAHGAVIHWRRPARWLDDRLWLHDVPVPHGPMILATDLTDPDPTESVWYSAWQGTGTPASSFVADMLPLDGPGQLVRAVSGPDRWVALGWHTQDLAHPPDTTGATLIHRTRRRSPLAPDRPLWEPQVLRVGSAANLIPRHGFGLAQTLAAARLAGFMAAHWVIRQAPATAWAHYGRVMAPIRLWLRQGLPLQL
ncbi:MAG: hypothetical protein H7338_03465 [Candidatus Sericytochromatia bacterium]|nr:hypothetical protein [Candidatus Sericytochromatia bacterium]